MWTTACPFRGEGVHFAVGRKVPPLLPEDIWCPLGLKGWQRFSRLKLGQEDASRPGGSIRLSQTRTPGATGYTGQCFKDRLDLPCGYPEDPSCWGGRTDFHPSGLQIRTKALSLLYLYQPATGPTEPPGRPFASILKGTLIP